MKWVQVQIELVHVLKKVLSLLYYAIKWIILTLLLV